MTIKPLKIFVCTLLLGLIMAGCQQADNLPATPQEPPAQPLNPQCSYGQETLTSVNIAPNQTCDFTATTVTGNVTVGQGGVISGVGMNIDGDLSVKGAKDVVLQASNIAGNVSVQNSEMVDFSETTVAGNGEFSGNTTEVALSSNTFEGNLTLSGNTGTVGLDENSVSGDLNCTGNAAAPTGLDNVVTGDMLGQCKTLETM